MAEDYKPRYRWKQTWPGETGLGGKPLQDFQGWDGDIEVGRIRFEPMGLKRDTWQWSGHGPKHGLRQRLLPHQGYEPTARLAAAKAEDYYDRLLAHNRVLNSET